MKRKVLLLTTVIAAGSFAVPACAADMSADEILKKMTEYSATVDSISGIVNMNVGADVTITSEGQEAPMSFNMSGNFELHEIMKPITMSLVGDYKMDVAGQAMTMSMETYAEADEDEKNMDTYTRATADGEDSGWIHQRTDLTSLLASFGVSSFDELATLDFNTLLGDQVTLDWTVEEKDNTYVLASKMNFGDFMPLIQNAIAAQESAEEIPEEALTIVESILGAFNLNMSYEIDRETFAPISAHIDMNDTDLETLNSIISGLVSMLGTGEDGSSMSVSIDKISDSTIDMTYTYDDVSEILIPAEALATEITDLAEVETEQ